ncbi:unnamed protein product, partial [Prorocentrum cordatum]
SAQRARRDRQGGQLRHGHGAAGRGRAALPLLRSAGAGPLHRRVPAQRSAPEGVSTGWGVPRRRGRSLPAGALFALAERVRSARQPSAAPLASEARWWHAGVEDVEATVVETHGDSGYGGSLRVVLPAPRPAAHGAPHPPLPGPGTACSTACTSSPPGGVDPSIVTAYLLANDVALFCGRSEVATGGSCGELGMQEDGRRDQGLDRSPNLSSASPRFVGDGGIGMEIGGGGGRVDGADGADSVDGAFATEAPARGPERLLALRRHVFAGTVALTVDRGIRRPGWPCDGGEVDPPAPSASEAAAGRQRLRSQFGPGSPWRAWASKERQRRQPT